MRLVSVIASYGDGESIRCGFLDVKTRALQIVWTSDEETAQTHSSLAMERRFLVRGLCMAYGRRRHLAPSSSCLEPTIVDFLLDVWLLLFIYQKAGNEVIHSRASYGSA
jgi:hypothetical protein